MNDQYGNGRWGTGARPVGTGPAQSAWDQGAAARRAEQLRREQQSRDEMYRRMRVDQQKREVDSRRARGEDTQAGERVRPTSNAVSAGTEGEGGGLITLAAIGGFTFLLVTIWNILLGTLPAFSGAVGTALKFSPWVVGVAGIAIGIRIQKTLEHIASWILVAAVLFFGSAIAYGLYKGFTSAGG